MKTTNTLHRTFVLWPLSLIVVTLTVAVFTYWLVRPTKVFVGAAVIFGVIHSLSTLEELTGGRELALLTIPLILAGDAFLTLWGFSGVTSFQKIILFIQFLAIIVLIESVIVFLLRSRLQAFCERRNLG